MCAFFKKVRLIDDENTTRVSARPNAGARLAFSAESSCSHFRSEPDHAATDITNHPVIQGFRTWFFT